MGTAVIEPGMNWRFLRPYFPAACRTTLSSMSIPVTVAADAASMLDPYPSPEARSRTRLPSTSVDAKAYRCKCSYAIVDSLIHGRKRSPVHSNIDQAPRQDILQVCFKGLCRTFLLNSLKARFSQIGPHRFIGMECDAFLCERIGIRANQER